MMDFIGINFSPTLEDVRNFQQIEQKLIDLAHVDKNAVLEVDQKVDQILEGKDEDDFTEKEYMYLSMLDYMLRYIVAYSEDISVGGEVIAVE